MWVGVEGGCSKGQHEEEGEGHKRFKRLGKVNQDHEKRGEFIKRLTK